MQLVVVAKVDNANGNDHALLVMRNAEWGSCRDEIYKGLKSMKCSKDYPEEQYHGPNRTTKKMPRSLQIGAIQEITTAAAKKSC